MQTMTEAAFVESVLDKMRYMLKKRGADGVQGLARNFRICDTNGSVVFVLVGAVPLLQSVCLFALLQTTSPPCRL